MCGILGVLRLDGEPVKKYDLEVLNHQITHRGPDDEGYYVDNHIGLAMRRLSIIDLKSGSQPIISQDKNLVIIFNGEIYNYKEIRKELQALGYEFCTQSDTEVILNGYSHWGVEIFSRLNGMWGIAIYDKRKRELVLSRDRLGKKQLYYSLNSHYFVFGSEMKIPMMYGKENRTLRIAALPEFLTYGYIGGPETAIRTIRSLPESSWARVDERGSISIHPYWEISTQNNQISSYHSEEEAARETYNLLVDAVRIRLVSDVPISVMLSSGLDSNSCAYILAKELGARLKTFSIGYSDKDFDESLDAGEFAKKLDMPWQGGMITGRDVAENFQDYIAHCDSLQSNTAQIVYYFVCRMIHDDGFKVAINGSGGDELFAGYRTYQANVLYRYYRHLPNFITQMAFWLAQKIPATLGRVSLDYMLKKFTECPYHSPLNAHAYWRTMYSINDLHDLLAPRVIADMPPFTRVYDAAYRELKLSSYQINGLLGADLKAWLIPMLPWVDNISMAHSVELRLPYLDYRLVEHALSLPSHYLFSGWELKKLMKRFLKNRLPDEVLYRRKRGTHLPISRWLSNELADIRQHYLSDEVLNREGLFNMPAIRQLEQEHLQRKADNTFKLWNLIVFSAWKEHNSIRV